MFQMRPHILFIYNGASYHSRPI